MEGGSSLGTWVAYVLIVSFLLVLGFVVARTIALYSLLVIAPLHDAWKWLTRPVAERPAATNEADPPAERAAVTDRELRVSRGAAEPRS